MVLILVVISIAVVVFIGFYILSFNFLLGDFYNFFGGIFQSDIINRNNFTLTQSYANYFNSDSGNNNLYCYDEFGNYEDDDCLFRGLYGFLPPNKTIDLGLFSANTGNSIVLDSVGITGVDLLVTNLKTNNIQKYSFTTGTTNNFSDGGQFNIKLKNLSSDWGQYFLYISGSEGIKDLSINNGHASIGQYYNLSYGKKKVLYKDVKYEIGISLTLGEIIEFLGLDPYLEEKLSKIHFNAGGVNFGGVFINTDNINTETQDIYIDKLVESKSCNKILGGYYWNSIRGDIVWPLDNETLSNLQSKSLYTGLTITGGLYTNCIGTEDSVYGELIFYYTNTLGQKSELFSLQAGREYNFTGNIVVNSANFTDSLQSIQYNGIPFPVGIVYDSDFGIGFIGGKLDTPSTLNNIINKVNSPNLGKVNSLINNISEKAILFNDDVKGAAVRYIKGITLQ